MPTTNMTSISAQQQPTQKAPCARPRPQASRAGLRPRQCAVTCASGLWHRSRQRRFSAENWKSPAPASTSAASAQPLKVSQAEPPHRRPDRHVRGVRRQPEPGPGGEVAGGRQRHEPAAVGAATRSSAAGSTDRQRRRQHHRRQHQQPAADVERGRQQHPAPRHRRADGADEPRPASSRHGRGSAPRGSPPRRRGRARRAPPAPGRRRRKPAAAPPRRSPRVRPRSGRRPGWRCCA